MSIRSTDLNPRVRRMIAEQDARLAAVVVPPLAVLIVVPLPPKPLWPNARYHFMAKARAVKEYRQLVEVAVLHQLGYARNLHGWTHATEQATFIFRTRRFADPDNCLAALKAVWDGLQDAGLLANDDNLTHLPVKRLVDRDNPRLMIRVWPTACLPAGRKEPRSDASDC